MANYNVLKAAIAEVVKQNGNNEITGALLQQALLSMINSLGVGYQFMGVAHPGTEPSGTDQRLIYLAFEAGVYSEFDNITVADGEVALLYLTTEWHKVTTAIVTKTETNDIKKSVGFPFIYAPGKFVGDGLAQSGSDGPYYYVDSIQEKIRGVKIYGFSVYIRTAGDFSIVKGTDVGESTYQYETIKTFVGLSVGRCFLWLDEPITLGQNESVGFGLQNESGRFGYLSAPQTDGTARYYNGERWIYPNINMQIGIISADISGLRINNVPIITDGGYELTISDANGNTIVVFSGGHIKTKNFDSRNINSFLLSKFSGKKIGIIGDSISTYAGWLPSDIPGYDGAEYRTYYPSGNVNNPAKTWWYKMAKLLGLDPTTDISNCAWSGSRVTGDSLSTTSAAAGCSTRRISDLTLRGFTPDIIICFISCNDWAYEVGLGTWQTNQPIPREGTITTFREAYALMINKIHTTYPNARVFCCTNLDDFARDSNPGWPSNNDNGVSTYEWNKNLIEVANALGCDVIDMNRCGINYANILQYVVDSGLHPNDAGHTMMAQKVASELVAKY